MDQVENEERDDDREVRTNRGILDVPVVENGPVYGSVTHGQGRRRSSVRSNFEVMFPRGHLNRINFTQYGRCNVIVRSQ